MAEANRSPRPLAFVLFGEAPAAVCVIPSIARLFVEPENISWIPAKPTTLFHRSASQGFFASARRYPVAGQSGLDQWGCASIGISMMTPRDGESPGRAWLGVGPCHLGEVTRYNWRSIAVNRGNPETISFRSCRKSEWNCVSAFNQQTGPVQRGLSKGFTCEPETGDRPPISCGRLRQRAVHRLPRA